ncbi:segregation/condensation protein A [Egbenema bharatensis]|uniref:segregation/condensation protein A n=1 Tax=Egbenema bharatensis TaxID=3463334 RepID=UPI003A8B91B3
MATSLAQNAIALLIDLAERGEIDPWNVKVIEVIDRFLSKLQPGKVATVESDGRSPYESDLTESGQAFLYASMLLLLKADSLVRQELEAEPAEEAEMEFGEMPGFDAPLPPNLERTLRRRAVSPPTPNRRVTLQELIGQLNVMAAAIAEHTPRRLSARRPRPQTRSQAMRTIAQLAHHENLSEIATILEQFLADYWQAEAEESWLDFEELLTLWISTQSQQSAKSKKLAQPVPDGEASGASDVHDRVGVFWALLFLSAQSKVELNQETFYQDLKVRQLHPEEVVKPIDAPSYVLPD